MLPHARDTNLTVNDVNGALMVHDLEHQRVHRLSRAAAVIWRHCDGSHTVEDLARILRRELQIEADPEVVWLVLNDLEQAHLLRDLLLRPRTIRGFSRRQALSLGVVGATALLLEGCGVDSGTSPSSTPAAQVPVRALSDSTSPTAEPSPSPSPSASPSPEPSPEPSPSPSPSPAPAGECEPVLQLKKEGIRKVGERTETQTVRIGKIKVTRVLAVERDFRPTYLLGSPKCEGRCAKGKDGKCEESLTFNWVVTPAAGTTAAIVGGAGAEEVTVRWSGNGTVDLAVTVTLQCTCAGVASGARVQQMASIKSNVNVFA